MAECRRRQGQLRPGAEAFCEVGEEVATAKRCVGDEPPQTRPDAAGKEPAERSADQFTEPGTASVKGAISARKVSPVEGFRIS
jgi:hypothetical protein